MPEQSGQLAISPSEQFADVARAVALTDQLRTLVPPERLAANALAYPHMREELTEREERQLEAIRARLLQMPLVHGAASFETLAKIEAEGLKPFAQLSTEVRGNTLPIDVSLGLDQYVFLDWGKPDEQFHGSQLVEVDTAAVLDSLIVTPEDIIPAGGIGAYQEESYDNLPDDIKARLDRKYFGRMVTGRAWLDILARQVLRFAQRKPGFPFPINTYEFLGEIKHLGPIDPKFIQRTVSVSSDRQRFARDAALLEQCGVAFDTPESTLELRRNSASFDPEQAKAFERATWDDIMAIE